MNPAGKAYLRRAIERGEIYTTPIHAGNRIPCGQAMNQVSPSQPWGHPQDVEGIIHNSVKGTSFPKVLCQTLGRVLVESMCIIGICKILIDLNIF